jgi:hypothetical protein
LRACCPLVLGEDVGRGPAAVFDLQAVRFGPGAYVSVGGAQCGSLAPVVGCAGGAGDPPAGFDIPGQG